jgi:methionyl-tRNA formyltransferase
MLATSDVDITPDMTTPMLHDLLSTAGANLLRDSLSDLLQGELFPKAQDEDLVTYAHKIEKTEGLLEWEKLSAKELAAKVRALKPWPGTYFEFNDDVIKQASTYDEQLDFNSDKNQNLAKKLTIKSEFGVFEY